ncbi:helix-turn-helix domain-containing protein [Streptomyces sp. UNOC14_S4]|uniref:helix-turn-helix domain-containing protein n=1 Tax=Streptomyces sp. UNOC14_S4 TaxID=2872340 RepID=UPI001E2F93F3|nr:helix-turn-helix domain-containing protein [Streptomyces sp. UNOC14_S4]MCC3769850.1 helix-turn-helix domain-containing protein [Streptomyces sp. UNOC14_S4]
MTSLFDQLDKEEAIVRGELAALREKVAQAEERMAHLAITRTTLVSLGVAGAEDGAGEPSSRSSGDSPADGETGHSTDGPERDEAAGPADGSSGPEPQELSLEVARERILALLAETDRAVKLQDLVPAIGEKRTETTRSRLKTLVKEGLVVEDPVAWFALKSPAAAAAETPGEARVA